MADLEVSKLVKRYGEHRALNGVDLSVRSGEFFCVLGPSAAGKTTLLRTIAGLDSADSGQLSIAGEELTHASIQARDVAMIFQSFALYPHLSVQGNLMYPLKESGMAPATARARVQDVAEQLGITHTLARLPSTLSGGEQQRVAIGRAIIRRPRMLLLDEPLTNLDAKLRHETRARLKRLHRELGITMIYATPDQLEALSMGERIAVLNEGEVCQVGTPDELYDTPTDRFVAGLVGSPTMNLVAASKPSDSANGRKIATPLGEFADGPWAGAIEPLATGAPLMFGFRPQDVLLHDEGGPQLRRSASFVAKVHLLEPLGDLTVLDLVAAGQPLKMVLPESKAASMRVHDELEVAIALDQTHVFSTATGAALR